MIDISADVRHRILNYGVVFAPRAGHHSNIAERVALFLRDNGMTRMAVVEQKCAEDIPLFVDGCRHREDFEGQVDQYRQVLELLKLRTGHPAHLIAICQPGPLLLSTLILHPELGKTFGSAGSPMHTEAESGILTDFARRAGEDYIDRMIAFFGHTIDEDHPGALRPAEDARRIAVDEGEDEHRDPDGADDGLQVPDRHALPKEALQHLLQLARLDRGGDDLVDQLPRDARQILLLRFERGFGYREIARLTGMKRRTSSKEMSSSRTRSPVSGAVETTSVQRPS